MAFVPESASYDSGIYQIEVTDQALGGLTGTANFQAKGLANRTAYLKTITDEVISARGSYSALSGRLASMQSMIDANLSSVSAMSSSKQQNITSAADGANYFLTLPTTAGGQVGNVARSSYLLGPSSYGAGSVLLAPASAATSPTLVASSTFALASAAAATYMKSFSAAAGALMIPPSSASATPTSVASSTFALATTSLNYMKSFSAAAGALMIPPTAQSVAPTSVASSTFMLAAASSSIMPLSRSSTFLGSAASSSFMAAGASSSIMPLSRSSTFLGSAASSSFMAAAASSSFMRITSISTMWALLLAPSTSAGYPTLIPYEGTVNPQSRGLLHCTPMLARSNFTLIQSNTIVCSSSLYYSLTNSYSILVPSSTTPNLGVIISNSATLSLASFSFARRRASWGWGIAWDFLSDFLLPPYTSADFAACFNYSNGIIMLKSISYGTSNSFYEFSYPAFVSYSPTFFGFNCNPCVSLESFSGGYSFSSVYSSLCRLYPMIA